MADNRITITQIGDDETVEAIDAFLSGLEGWVLLYGNMHREGMALRLAGYRRETQRPLLREHDPDRPGDDFVRTHYNSMTFDFKRADEAQAFGERFG